MKPETGSRDADGATSPPPPPSPSPSSPASDDCSTRASTRAVYGSPHPRSLSIDCEMDSEMQDADQIDENPPIPQYRRPTLGAGRPPIQLLAGNSDLFPTLPPPFHVEWPQGLGMRERQNLGLASLPPFRDTEPPRSEADIHGVTAPDSPLSSPDRNLGYPPNLIYEDTSRFQLPLPAPMSPRCDSGDCNHIKCLLREQRIDSAMAKGSLMRDSHERKNSSECGEPNYQSSSPQDGSKRKRDDNEDERNDTNGHKRKIRATARGKQGIRLHNNTQPGAGDHDGRGGGGMGSFSACAPFF